MHIRSTKSKLSGDYQMKVSPEFSPALNNLIVYIESTKNLILFLDITSKLNSSAHLNEDIRKYIACLFLHIEPKSNPLLRDVRINQANVALISRILSFEKNRKINHNFGDDIFLSSKLIMKLEKILIDNKDSTENGNK